MNFWKVTASIKGSKMSSPTSWIVITFEGSLKKQAEEAESRVRHRIDNNWVLKVEQIFFGADQVGEL